MHCKFWKPRVIEYLGKYWIYSIYISKRYFSLNIAKHLFSVMNFDMTLFCVKFFNHILSYFYSCLIIAIFMFVYDFLSENFSQYWGNFVFSVSLLEHISLFCESISFLICEMCSFTLIKDHKRNVFENKSENRIFGSNRDGISDRKKFRIEERHS